jgi:hypothetical protein
MLKVWERSQHCCLAEKLLSGMYVVVVVLSPYFYVMDHTRSAVSRKIFGCVCNADIRVVDVTQHR